MLVENMQRSDLSPLQEAHAFQRLLNGNATQADVARRVGVPAATVQQRFLILRLDPEVQALYGRNEKPGDGSAGAGHRRRPERQRGSPTWSPPAG